MPPQVWTETKHSKIPGARDIRRQSFPPDRAVNQSAFVSSVVGCGRDGGSQTIWVCECHGEAMPWIRSLTKTYLNARQRFQDLEASFSLRTVAAISCDTWRCRAIASSTCRRHVHKDKHVIRNPNCSMWIIYGRKICRASLKARRVEVIAA